MSRGAEPARSRCARCVRRALRAAAWTVLVLAVLLTTVWWFRREWLLPLLRPQLEAALASALRAERVAIGAVDGDWLRAVDARDVVVEGGAPPLRSLLGARLQVRWSLWQLLTAGASGLHDATLTAESAEVDLRPAAPTPAEPADAAPFDAGAYESLRNLLPGGATVRIERLHLLAGSGETVAAFSLDVGPGPGPRSLHLAAAGVTVDVELPTTLAVAGTAVHAQIDARDPGSLLEQFGLWPGVREGSLRATVEASLAPPRVMLRLDLAGLVHRGQRLDQSHVVGWCDGERLAIDSATVDLPGLAAELRELTLASPFAAAPFSLQDLAGRFVVRVDDLAPHLALLPEAVRGVMPIRGRLTGAFTGGRLQFAASELAARGARVAIEEGSFPLASADWRAAEGSLRFRVALDAFATELPALGAASFSGAITGEVAGSLERPRGALRLDLGTCRSEHGELAGLAGNVRADAQSLAVTDLRVQALRLPALGGAPTDARIEASCGLRSAAIVPDTLAATVELTSLLPAELLAPAFAAHGLGRPPAGPVVLRCEARHDRDGITVAALRVRTAPDSPVDVALDGAGRLPLHWSGGPDLAVLAAGHFELQARAARPAADADEPPIAFDGTLTVDAASVALRPFQLRVGSCRLGGEVAAAQGLATLLAGGPAPASTPFRAAVDVAELDLAGLPERWKGGRWLRGRVTGRIAATGIGRDFVPDVALTLVDGELRGDGLPTLTDARVQLTARQGDGADRTLQVAAELSAALASAPGGAMDPGAGSVPIATAARVRCGDDGTVLEPMLVAFAGGQLAVELRSNLRRTDLLAGAIDAARTTLAGTLGVRGLLLDKLPAALLGGAAARGVVDGELAIDGTCAAFGSAMLRAVRLSLREGEFKSGDLPRFENLVAELEGGPHELTLRSLTGTLGAGHFAAQGTLRQGPAPLADAFADARLDLTCTGEDVLLYRGDGAKARASLRLTATGTPQRVVVGGQVVLGRGTKYVKRISLLPDLAARGGAAATEGLRLVELPPALGERLEFDVALTTGAPVEVRTSVFDADADIVAHLRGPGSAPRVEGTMALRSGMLRFPGASLRIVSGTFTFQRSEPLFPELRLQAEGKRMGFAIAMTVSGRYDRPQVQLSSVPPLPPEELIVLLATGQLPSTLAQRGPEGNARIVGSYFATEVVDAWFGSDSTERGESLFDRVTIESGREVSKNGTESMLIEFELSPTLAVQVERDAYEDYNLGLVLRFRFR